MYKIAIAKNPTKNQKQPFFSANTICMAIFAMNLCSLHNI